MWSSRRCWFGRRSFVPPTRTHREQVQAIQAENFATFFNVRLAALQRELSDAASAKDTIAALATYDPAILAAQNQRLTQLISTAERVDIIPKGKAEVDLSAKVPISFAALDVIKRAETQEYVGPEASQVNQRPVFYSAKPVTDAGTGDGRAVRGRFDGLLLRAAEIPS